MYSLDFEIKNNYNFLMCTIKIKLQDAIFETKMYGSPGSRDYPSNETLYKWIKNIENNIMFFEMFTDEQSELHIGIKNNYFVLNQLTVPIKYIKNDLIKFLQKFREANHKTNTQVLTK